MFQGHAKNTQTKTNNTVCNNFYIVRIIMLHASSNILNFWNLQHMNINST